MVNMATKQTDADETADDQHPAGMELDAIAAEAAMLEGGPGQVPGAPAAPALSTTAELAEALRLARSIGKAAFSDWPEYGVSVWSDDQLQAIATHGGAIMDRNGWTMGDLWATWGPYIGLAGATAPPALATYARIKQVKAEAAERERQRKRAESGQDAARRNADAGPA